MSKRSFTFKHRDSHHEAAYSAYEHPTHGKAYEFDGVITTPQQDVDAVNQRTKIHPITDRRAQPWREYTLANLHNHDVTKLPSLQATNGDVKEFLFFVLGCDRYGRILEDEEQATVQFIQSFPHGGAALRQFKNKEDWMVDVPYTWTSVSHKTWDISEHTRRQIAKHCCKAITPLIKAECRKARPKTRFVEKLKVALCFGKTAKRSGSPPPPYPPPYAEKEKFFLDSERLRSFLVLNTEVL